MWRWWSRRFPLAVILGATGLLYTVLALAENAHLLTYGFDLGVYYEALRGYAHFGLPLVELKGLHYDLLGDHFEPMVAILAPTYWIWPQPDVLLVDQAVLVALSVIPVWMFTERRFGAGAGVPRLTTTCLVAAYALAWEIQSLVGFDFHSLAFAVPILAVAIERADAGRWRAATFWILSLLLVKEDLALVVAAFGVYAFLRGRRRLGVFITAVGVAAFGVLVGLVVPAFSGGIYPHWSYGELGPGPWPALRYVVLHPAGDISGDGVAENQAWPPGLGVPAGRTVIAHIADRHFGGAPPFGTRTLGATRPVVHRVPVRSSVGADYRHGRYRWPVAGGALA